MHIHTDANTYNLYVYVLTDKKTQSHASKCSNAHTHTHPSTTPTHTHTHTHTHTNSPSPLLRTLPLRAGLSLCASECKKRGSTFKPRHSHMSWPLGSVFPRATHSISASWRWMNGGRQGLWKQEGK